MGVGKARGTCPGTVPALSQMSCVGVGAVSHSGSGGAAAYPQGALLPRNLDGASPWGRVSSPSSSPFPSTRTPAHTFFSSRTRTCARSVFVPVDKA